MKQRTITIAWLIAIICSLLSSCGKSKQDRPTPIIEQQSLQSIQELFVQKQYAQQLNSATTTGKSTLTWKPVWHNTFWKNTAGKRYAYVPLQAQTVDEQPAPVKNIVKYLRFDISSKNSKAVLFSCYSKIAKGDIGKIGVPMLTQDLLRSFTGDIVTLDLESNESLHSSYTNGVWQRPSSKASTGSKINTCKAYYICHWYITCDNSCPCGPQPTGDYYSYGEKCEEPYGYTTCGYWTRYRLLDQTVDYVCDDPNDPQPDPTTPPPATPLNRTLADGDYVIRNGNSYKVLAIANESQQPNSLAIQNDLDRVTYPSELWHVTYNPSDGYYTIQSINSGLVLQSEGDYTYTNRPVTLQSATGADNQKWQLIPRDYDPNAIWILSKYNGLVLGVEASSTSAGATVWQMGGTYRDATYNWYFN